MLKKVKLKLGFSESEVIKELPQRGLTNPKILEEVNKIIESVKEKGDEALFKYTLKLDGVDLRKTGLKVKDSEISQAYKLVSRDFLKALAVARNRIYAFHSRQIENSWFQFNENNFLGQIVSPLERVGIYVPGGRTVYPSSVLMNAIPAIIAGVNQIAMCTPPDKKGHINPHLLVAAAEVGICEIYKIGGAQAIAALAFGTASIPKVDKITGPGNIYVTLAKKLVTGNVGIDMLAGPSEIAIVADETAHPDFIAADLLSQAEHDIEAMAILIFYQDTIGEKVLRAIDKQLKKIKTHKIAEESLKKNARFFEVDSLEEAMRLVNIIAPEHLELLIKNPFLYLSKVKRAGAIFIGNYTPEVIGDYLAGPNHILPTNGTARFASPLNVSDFLKKTSILFFEEDGIKKLVPYIKVLAEVEGLDAHARSAEIRVRRKK